MEKKKGTKKRTNEKPISVYPLQPEEVLKRLLETPPPKKKKRIKSK